MRKVLVDIESGVSAGMCIPKPQAKADFVVKGWGTRRGERALIYTIPNHKNPTRPYEKGITVSEWERAYDQLNESGDFNRPWFNKFMPACAAEGGCNFTTIGGIFTILGYAQYEPGRYVRCNTVIA